MEKDNKPDPLATMLMTSVEKAVGGVTNRIDPQADSGPPTLTRVFDSKTGKVKDGPAEPSDIVATVPVFHERPGLPKPKPKPEPEPWRSDTEKLWAVISGARRMTFGEDFSTDPSHPSVTDMPRFVGFILFNAATTEADVNLVTADEREKLIAIQADMDDLRAQQARWSPHAANEEWLNQQHRARETVKAGKVDELPPMRTRPELQEDYTLKRKALESHLVTITHERAVPLVKTILEKFSAAVERYLRDTEERDREMADACGYAHRPSLSWRCAASVAIRFCGPSNFMIPSHGISKTPTAMLEGLVDLEKEVQ